MLKAISHWRKRLRQLGLLVACAFIIQPQSAVFAQETQLDSLEIRLQNASSDTVKLSLIYQIAELLEVSDKERAIFYYEQALSLDLGDKEKASLENTIGLLWWQLGSFENAEKYFSVALDFYKKQQDSLRQGRLYNNLGSVIYNQGRRNQALEIYQEGLSIRRATGDTAGVTLVLNNIGQIYQDWGMYSDAMRWHQEARSLAKHIPDPRKLSYTYSNIGLCYEHIQKFDSALYYHHLAHQTHAEKEPMNPSYSYYMVSIGDCYDAMGEYDSALQYYRNSLFHAKRVQNLNRIAISQFKLGETFLNLHTLDSADLYTSRSIKTASRNKYLDLENELTFVRARIEEKRGNYPQAYRLFRKATAVKDSLFALKELEDFKSLQIDYYLEQEESENALLRKNLEIQELNLKKSRITRYVLLMGISLVLLVLFFTFRNLRIQRNLSAKLQKNERELKESNQNKDKFFSIISHDLKSPFNSLLGFSQMLETDYDKMDEEERRKYIRLQHRTARQAYNLLESLLQWARTQTGRMDFEYEKVSLSEQCDAICELYQMNAANKNIQLINLVDPDMQVQADRKALDTILRNLVSNAIKFTGFGGKVKLEAKHEGRHIVLSVNDNGIGMTSMTINKMFRIEESFTSPGTDKETGTGLGLILCKELVERQDGKIWVESKEGEGSTFFVRLLSASSAH